MAFKIKSVDWLYQTLRSKLLPNEEQETNEQGVPILPAIFISLSSFKKPKKNGKQSIYIWITVFLGVQIGGKWWACRKWQISDLEGLRHFTDHQVKVYMPSLDTCLRRPKYRQYLPCRFWFSSETMPSYFLCWSLNCLWVPTMLLSLCLSVCPWNICSNKLPILQLKKLQAHIGLRGTIRTRLMSPENGESKIMSANVSLFSPSLPDSQQHSFSFIYHK